MNLRDVRNGMLLRAPKDAMGILVFDIRRDAEGIPISASWINLKTGRSGGKWNLVTLPDYTLVKVLKSAPQET